MLEFRNFGKKSLNEIKAKLHEMGLHLGMDLTRYGIDGENAKDRVREYTELRKSRKEKDRKKENESETDEE
jgi:DNA-directed RNA polymerase subunit alpha